MTTRSTENPNATSKLILSSETVRRLDPPPSLREPHAQCQCNAPITSNTDSESCVVAERADQPQPPPATERCEPR